MKNTLLLTLLMVLFLTPLYSQTVTIDHQTQRFLGNTTDLERERYFNIHTRPGDADIDAFANANNVTYGRGFYAPFSYAKNATGTVGTYPAPQGGGTEVRNVTRYVGTEHPENVIRWNLDKTAAADWAVEYYKNFVSDADRPEFFEPMNEPFVKAADAVFMAPSVDSMRYQMAEWFGEIGAKMHAAPELANMKVIGYASAWPDMEKWNFGHWDSRMKMFMDVAGEHMDAIAVHLYDGAGTTSGTYGDGGTRSGSNSEAILDLIEAYSFIKWGTVKDHAITEYGQLSNSLIYNEFTSASSVETMNHILFNLLDREDNMAISIPFSTGKAEWFLTAANNYQPYGATLFVPSNIGQPVPAGWVPTPRTKFYELWSEVGGTRVDIATDNPDIQVQAFVNGPQLQVALNNLDDVAQTVNLEFLQSLNGLQSISIKTLEIYPNQSPVLTNTSPSTAPASLTLISGETAILTYTFNEAITFNNTIRNIKYYSNNYLEPISAGVPILFTYDNVNTGEGHAIIRLCIGRNHLSIKIPEVSVNGTLVPVPTNWEGYDQTDRDDFFGLIEIPVPISLIQATNTVSVTFPDAGGHVSSAILQVATYDSTPIVQAPYPAGPLHQIPGIIEFENYDSGGEGISYHDADAENLGYTIENVPIRITEGVDISTVATGGYEIGWTQVGEWLEYSVDVAQAGVYQVDVLYSNGGAITGEINLEFNGVDVTGTISCPPTGSWNTQNVATAYIVLEEGENIIRTNILSGLNLDYMEFIPLQPTVSFNPTPVFLTSDLIHTFEIDYETFVESEIFVELWSTSQGFISSGSELVSLGASNIPVSVAVNTPLAEGIDYFIKVNIRPENGDWTTAFDNQVVEGVVVFGPQAPFNNVLHTIPGVIQIEDFDIGGQSVAYYVTTLALDTLDYRDDDVELVHTGAVINGEYAATLEATEWLEYTVNVAETQTYEIDVDVATLSPAGQLSVSVDNVDVTGVVDLPTTGDWNTYATVPVGEVNLSSGIHVFQIKVENTGVYLDSWSVTPAAYVEVQPKVILEGAYNSTNALMRDDLRASSYIPTVEPYSAMGYTLVNSVGGETIEDPATLFAVTGDDAIVDWLFLELRDPADASVVLATRSALLQRDGDVVDMDGVSPVRFSDMAEGDYFLAIRHRNHLAVMPAAPVNLATSGGLVDFSDPALSMYGNNARIAIGGIAALRGGDANNDGQVNAADRSEVWNKRNTVGYNIFDIDLNGSCTAADRSMAWNKRNTAEQIP